MAALHAQSFRVAAHMVRWLDGQIHQQAKHAKDELVVSWSTDHVYVQFLQQACDQITDQSRSLKRGYIEFKYYADAIHSDRTPPG